MLGKSRFNRRQHRIADLFLTVFDLLAAYWKDLNKHSIYVLDSFPIVVCDNYRITRSRRYHGEVWRSYQARKKQFFYGLKLHLMVTGKGQPVEFFLTPGSWSDTRALKMYRFDLPEEALITGDKAYNDYGLEDVMKAANLILLPLRTKNSHRPLRSGLTYLLSYCRKIIETTGSLIERLLPKHIHAVTARGFELKVALFVIAASFKAL